MVDITIPGYQIKRVLGKGAMATVYLAIQESFEREVAVKVMSAALSSDPGFGERFQREAKIVSQLTHPNIVTVYDVGQVGNHHYLSMEYVPGKDLREEHFHINLKQKLQVIKDVAAALDFASKKGYVHRDVKPENIMLHAEDGRAVLMDFGVARAADGDQSMTKTGMVIGTPFYMSPEQAQGAAVDSRSDIYSLGVVLFHLLAGYLPFNAESSVAIGIKHLTEPVPFLPQYLHVFQPIIDKVMEKQADKRYQTGEDLIAALAAIGDKTLEKIAKQQAKQDQQNAVDADAGASTEIRDASEATIVSRDNVTPLRRLDEKSRLKEKFWTLLRNRKPADNKEHVSFGTYFLALILVAFSIYSWQQGLFDPAMDVLGVNSNDIEQEIVAAVVVEEELPENVVIAALQEPPATINETKETAEAVVIEEVPSSELVHEPIDKQSIQENELLELENVTQQFVTEAQQKIKQNEFDAATLAIENGLLVDADNADLLELKNTLSTKQEKQLAEQNKIAEILVLAEDNFNKGQWTVPAENNAVALYRQILALDPNNKVALTGLEKIEASLYKKSKTALDSGDLGKARLEGNKAFAVFPESTQLQTLSKQILAAEADKKRLAIEANKPKILSVIVNDQMFNDINIDQKLSLIVDRTIYIGMSYKGLEKPTTVMQAVLYDGGHVTKIAQVPVIVTGKDGQAFFRIDRPVEGFQEGSYTLDLLLNDQVMKALSFPVGH